MSRKRWITIGVVFAVWTVITLLALTQRILFFIDRGVPIPWVGLTIANLTDWYSCALFLPVLFWLTRHHPLDGASWKRTVPIYLVATAACVAAKYLLYLPIFRAIRDPHVTYQSLLAGNALTELVILWVAIGVIHGAEYYRRYQAGRTHAAELETELARAQLDALAGQIQPHFLFNTLGAIGELMHQDTAAADRMLGLLADLLRETLRHGGGHDIALRDEIALVRRYTDIMQVRFGDRLTVRFDVPVAVQDALVPSFLLQPILENAFQHGVARVSGPSVIEVSAERDAVDSRMLIVRVRDNGPGLAVPSIEEGIGLGNTRHRLLRRYGPHHELALRSDERGGTEARLSIPFERAA